MTNDDKERGSLFMNELQEIKDRQKEHDKEMLDVKESIYEIKSELKSNSHLTGVCVKTMEELSKTMVDVRLAMCDISSQMKQDAKEKAEIRASIQGTNKRIDEVEEKVEEMEDKTKIDLSLWIKTNFWKIIGFIILLGLSFPTIGEFLAKIFK